MFFFSNAFCVWICSIVVCVCLCSYGYVFGLCEHMGCGAWTVSHAEGALQAADETDARALSFDGGLPVTTLLLTTIIRYITTRYITKGLY
jgi:ribose 5-phosphate isomerase RpiB